MSEYSDIEEKLRKFKPRGFTAEAKDRLLHHMLATPAGSKKLFFRISWWAAGIAAAAALVLAFFLFLSTAHNRGGALEKISVLALEKNSGSVIAPNIRIVTTDTAVVGQENKGIVRAHDGTPMRVMEYKFIDTVEFEHVKDQKHIRVVRPRYGVVLTGLDVD